MSATQEQMDRQRELRDAALASLGFGPSFVSGHDWSSAEFASCRICGACVRIAPGIADADQPATIHNLWHAAPASESTRTGNNP